MKTCLIFLCTYNGEKYLKEQIDSLLAQKDVEISIKIADDCSTDSTPQTLEEYSQKYPNISYSINSINKKFTYNFLDLFYAKNEKEYDYYAFCDQDDVWDNNKIIEAINALENMENKSENGSLYCSNLKVVNEKLEYIGMQEDDTVITKTNKYTYSYENIATGCTMVIDNKFYHHCLQYYPQGIKLHDYWIFLIAVYTATFYYDKNGYINYRQHTNNQIGTNKKKWTFKNFKRFFKYKGNQPHMLQELLNGFGQYISDEDKEILNTIIRYRKSLKLKFRLMHSKKFKKRRNRLIFKIKVLFNKL